jgi:drug/metabolite transporter (DMT)-like permease
LTGFLVVLAVGCCLMLAYLYIFLSVILGALKVVVFRHSMKTSWDHWTANITHNVFGTMIVVAFLPFPDWSKLDSNSWILILTMTIAWTAGCYFNMKSLKYLDAAVGELIGALNFVLVTVVGIFLFKEAISFFAAIGILLIVTSIILHAPPGKINLDRGVTYRILAAAFIAIGVLCTKLLAGKVATNVIVTTSFMIPGILFILLRPRALRDVVPSLRACKGLLLVGTVLNTASFYFFTEALALGNLVTLYTVRQTYIIFVFLFGLFLLKENEHKFRRCLSCFVSALGAIVVCQF